MDIFVGSLPFKLKDNELKELFEKHGEVTSAKIIIDKETRQNKGFGFVEMPKDEEALNAIKALDGVEVMGRMIKVNKSEKREPGSGPRTEAPRRPALNRDNTSGGSSSPGSGGGGYSGGGGGSFNRDSGGGGSSFNRDSGGGGNSFNRNSGGGGNSFRGGSSGGGGSFNKDNGRGGGFKGGPDKNKDAKSGGGFNKGGGKGTGIPKKRRDDEDED